MNFIYALSYLKSGQRLKRGHWKNSWIIYVEGKDDPEEKSSNRGYSVGSQIWNGKLAPWIGLKTSDNTFIPWSPSHIDIVANDWDFVMT
jgi:hypothetical protein